MSENLLETKPVQELKLSIRPKDSLPKYPSQGKNAVTTSNKRDTLIFVSLLLLTFFLKLPTFIDPYWQPDEGIYSSIVTQLNAGSLLYTDAWDNKPPLIFYLYLAFYKIFGFNLFSLHLLGLVVSLVNFIYFHLTLKVLFDQNYFYLPQIVFIVLVNTPLLEGNVVNAENIFLALTVPAFYFFLKYLKSRCNRFLYLTCLLYGLAVTVKIHPVFELMAVLLFLTVFLKFNLKSGYTSVLLKLITCAGFALLPYSLFILVFLIQGNFQDFVTAMFVNGMGYIWPSVKSEFILITLVRSLLFRTILLLTLSFYLLSQQTLKNKIEHLIFLTTLFSIYAIFLSGRENIHYLLQGVPYFILSFILISKKIKRSNHNYKIFSLTLQLIIGSLLCLLFASLFFWQSLIYLKEPAHNINAAKYLDYTLNYYPNFVLVVTGNLAQAEYNKMFFYVDIANFEELTLNTKYISNKKVFLWDFYPWYYFINNVKNPMKYVSNNYLDQENIDKETFIGVLASKTEYLVFHNDIFASLSSVQQEFILQSFTVDKLFGHYTVYRNIQSAGMSGSKSDPFVLLGK